MRNEGAAHFLVGSRQLAVGSKLEIKWPVACSQGKTVRSE